MTERRQSLGGGLYQCGICSATVICSATTSSRRVYRCRERQHVSRDAVMLDAFVSGVACCWLMDNGDRIDKRVTEDSERELEQIRSELDELAMCQGRGELTVSQVRIMSAPLLLRKRTIEDFPWVPIQPGDGEALCHDLWDFMPMPDRRRLIDCLMKVTINPAPRGRRPGGGYCDFGVIAIRPVRSP